MKKVYSLFLSILGFALHLANAKPPFLYKYRFYQLKDRLLTKFGNLTGFEIQHIQKYCFACDGTGVFYNEVLNFGEKQKIPSSQKCNKCRDGIYDEFWTILACYTLGNYSFHLPRDKHYKNPGELRSYDENGNLQTLKTIEGYINHETPRAYLGNEAFYWLCLFFDFDIFKDAFGRWGMSGRKFTPMVLFADFFYRIRTVIKSTKSYGQKILENYHKWRIEICRHKFPEGDYPYHVCKKCGISRWETEYDNSFPF